MTRLAVALLLCACNSGSMLMPPVDCFGSTGGFGGTGGSGEPETVLLVGHSADVRLGLSPTGACTNVVPTAVETQVFGPDNLPVGHSNSTAMTDGFTVFTTVSFTPTAAGNYHLVAQFAPNLGTAQTDVRTALDYTQAATAFSVNTTGCYHFAVLSSGAVVCIALSETRVFRAGVAVQTLSGTLSSVSGDTLWLASGRTITRWRDTGTGPLVAASPAVLTLLDPALTFSGATDDLWAATSQRLKHYVVEDGGFALQEDFSYSLQAADRPQLAVNDAGVLLAATGQLNGTVGSDGGVLTLALNASRVAGSETGALWLASNDGNASRFVPGQLLPTVSVLSLRASSWRVVTEQAMGLQSLDQPFTVAVQGRDAVLVKWHAVPFEVIPGFAVFENAGRYDFKPAPFP